MSTLNRDTLIYMANQIARNLAMENDPPAAVADHIRTFWTPSMRSELTGAADKGLDEIAFGARELLLEQAKPSDDR